MPGSGATSELATPKVRVAGSFEAVLPRILGLFPNFRAFRCVARIPDPRDGGVVREVRNSIEIWRNCT